jgi:hypothetical protein
MQSELRSLGLGVVAFLAVALATAAPAQADVMDCIEAVAPLDNAKQAAEVAAKAGQCMGQASGDPVMAATIVAMAALYAGDAFDDIAQCMGMIDSIIGKAVAQALLKTGVPLPGELKDKLLEVAEGSVKISDVPALQPLLMYVSCGCQVAGAPGTYEQIANDYIKSVNGCADFAADAVEFAGDLIESGIDAVGEGITKVIKFAESCFDGSFCGLVDDGGSDCVIHVFPKSKFGNWVPHDINWGSAASCGQWICAEGGWAKWQVKDGKKWSTCSVCNQVWALNDAGTCAPCGGPISKTISDDNMCLKAVTGYPTDDGAHCTKVESSLTCCAPGQVMKAVGWKDKDEVNCDLMQMAIGGQCTNVDKATAQCVAACPYSKYFDTVTGKCTSCNFDSVPVFTSTDSSIAQCKQCPPGLNGSGQTCEPCLPGQVVWTLSPPKKAQSQHGPMAAVPPKKEKAGATQKQLGPIAAKPLLDAIAQPPQPPAPGTAMAEIPGGWIGGLVEGGRCMACPKNWYPVYYSDPYKNSLGYCKECPPGTYLEVPKLSQAPPKDPLTGEWLAKPPTPKCVPLDCRTGIDPKHPHACLPPREAEPTIPGGPAPRACPRGTLRVGNACVPPTNRLVPRTRLACPPGTVPNARRTSCVPIGRIKPRTTAPKPSPRVLRLPTTPTLRVVPTPRAPAPRLKQPR